MKYRFIGQLILLGVFLGAAANAWAEDINAVLDWSEKRQLGTMISGMVTKVHVRPGMHVKAGDALLEMDQRYFKVRLLHEKARLEAARLQMEEAQREQERAIELFDRTVLSVFDRQKADIDLARAIASHAEAKANYEETRLDMEYSNFVAPYDGIVLNVLIAPGEVVVNENSSVTLVEIARADEMLVRCLLNSEQLSKLKIGQQVEAAFRGQWLDAEVHSMSMEADSTDSQAIRYLVTARLKVAPDDFARAGEASAIRLPD